MSVAPKELRDNDDALNPPARGGRTDDILCRSGVGGVLGGRAGAVTALTGPTAAMTMHRMLATTSISTRVLWNLQATRPRDALSGPSLSTSSSQRTRNLGGRRRKEKRDLHAHSLLPAAPGSRLMRVLHTPLGPTGGASAKQRGVPGCLHRGR